MTPRMGARKALAFSLALALGGCAGLFVQPPPHLYRLTAEHSFPAGLPRREVRLLVRRPEAAPGLDTERIALTSSPITINYFARSAWTAPLPELVRSALIGTFQKSGALRAGDRSRIGLDPNFILDTEIGHFEAEYRSPTGPPVARVTLKLQLLRRSSGRLVASATFESRKRAAVNDVPHIVFALDEAFDAVAGKIVVWVAEGPALPPPRYRSSESHH